MKLLATSFLALGATAISASQLPLGHEHEPWQIITGDETFAGLGSQAAVKPSQSNKHVYSEKWEQDGRTYIQDVHYDETGEFVSRQPVFELIKNEAFPEYQVRLRQPKLCDSSVKQYSGYLDISDDKHLFFWYVPFVLSRCPISTGGVACLCELVMSSVVDLTRPSLPNLVQVLRESIEPLQRSPGSVAEWFVSRRTNSTVDCSPPFL